MNNEYANRILLEFNTNVSGVDSNLVNAFTVKGQEYEHIGGKIKDVTYELVDVITPVPITIPNSVDLKVGSNNNTMIFNDKLILAPLEVIEWYE